MGPRGQMASLRPGPWLSLSRMSYEQAEGVAAMGWGVRELPKQLH